MGHYFCLMELQLNYFAMCVVFLLPQGSAREKRNTDRINTTVISNTCGILPFGKAEQPTDRISMTPDRTKKEIGICNDSGPPQSDHSVPCLGVFRGLGHDVDETAKEIILSRNLVDNITLHWPNGLIPFIFDYTMEGEIEQKARILEAMNMFHAETCIKFKFRTNEEDYLEVGTNFSEYCSSYVGRQGGVQQLTLGYNCYGTIGTIIHEMMHTLGFIHEQSRPDRDQYIFINTTNIQAGMVDNFKVWPEPVYLQIGPESTYNFKSIMHYSSCHFSANGWPTIVPKNNIYKKVFGRRRDWSLVDISRVNYAYDCRPGFKHSRMLTLADEMSAELENGTSTPAVSFSELHTCNLFSGVMSVLIKIYLS